MARGRVRPRKLGRVVAVRSPRKTIVLFCEGERTEPEYFEALRRLPAVRELAAVDLRIEPGVAGSAPITLVQKAVDAKERSRREEGEIDEVWCVFDVEWPANHPGLLDAVRLAEKNEIGLAISNPCFELWLILHFEECTAWLDNAAARRRRRDCDRSTGKGLNADHYMPHRNRAAKRAAALDKRHARDGTSFPQNNPSSGVHRIIASVSSPLLTLDARTD